jgi:hypothetical protein
VSLFPSKEVMLLREESIKALVKKVVPGSPGKTPYVVAVSNRVRGSITFSVKPDVWKEERPPEVNRFVFLTELVEKGGKKGGWRALSARFWQPSDEQ